jgi:prepilin peptidase CpaA
MTIWAAHIAVLAALGVAALSDLARRTIPDSCSLVILAAFFLEALAAPLGFPQVLANLSASLVLFAVGALLFSRGLFGGGDVKLLAAVALWAGWAGLPSVMLAMSLAGGALAVLCLIARKLPARWAGFLVSKEGIPYGVAIAVAGFLA